MSDQDPQITPMPENRWGIVITIFSGNGSGDRQVIWEQDGEFNVEVAKIKFYEALYVLIEDVHKRNQDRAVGEAGNVS